MKPFWKKYPVESSRKKRTNTGCNRFKSEARLLDLFLKKLFFFFPTLFYRNKSFTLKWKNVLFGTI